MRAAKRLVQEVLEDFLLGLLLGESERHELDDLVAGDLADGGLVHQQGVLVGGLDAGFFAHQEEIDLCWRLRSRGYRLVCTPSSVVYHVGGATLNVESPRKTFLNFRNNLLMLYKNLPEKDLKHVMHARFWLDYIAAAKFLLTGHYPNARAVYEARKAFHELKPSYEPVRRENLAKTKLSGIPELRKGSLILAFYLQGKKRFTEL